MNFDDAYNYSITNLKTFSLKSLKEIASKNNLPFIDKNQAINLIAYELLLPHFKNVGRMDVEDEDDDGDEEDEDEGKTALIIAARKNDADVVQLLLEKDAVVNAVDEDGWTALMRADNKYIKDLLRAHGAH